MSEWCETCRVRKPYKERVHFWATKVSAHKRALITRVETDAPGRMTKFRLTQPPEVE